MLLLTHQQLGCGWSYFTSSDDRLAQLTCSTTCAQCPLVASSTCSKGSWSNSRAQPLSRKRTEEVSGVEPQTLPPPIPRCLLTSSPVLPECLLLPCCFLQACRYANICTPFAPRIKAAYLLPLLLGICYGTK